MDLADTQGGAVAVRSPMRPAKPNDYAVMVDLCASSKVFNHAELDSLLLDFAACDPLSGDRLIVHQQGRNAVSGFIQYSPAPITDGSWYIYWIAVAKAAQGAGIGAALIAYAEADLRATKARQILIETSAKPAFATARNFYLGRGYQLVACIPDYYASGDDKCVFCKKL